jgi:hypothetical protein
MIGGMAFGFAIAIGIAALFSPHPIEGVLIFVGLGIVWLLWKLLCIYTD